MSGTKRVTKEERAELTKKVTDLYKTKSIQQVADELGRSFGFVHRLLTEAQVKKRRRGTMAKDSATASI